MSEQKKRRAVKKSDFRAQFSNYTWGCRSAIQKAIRRSEGDLLEEAFEELFLMDRDFLIRRVSVFAGEDCWPLVPEAMSGLKEVRTLLKKGTGAAAKQKGKRLLKALCRQLCMAEGAHDAESLASLVSAEKHFGTLTGKLETPMMETQYAAMKELYKRCEDGKEARIKVWGQLTKAAYKLEAPFVIEMVNNARYRYFMGGMKHEEDKFLACAVMALTEFHERPPIKIDKTIEFKQRKKPVIPLYCWDQHTRVGKRAMYRVCKELNISFGRLAQVWFMFVSAFLHPQMESEKWFRLERKLTRDRYSEKRFQLILDTTIKHIKASLAQEGGGGKPK